MANDPDPQNQAAAHVGGWVKNWLPLIALLVMGASGATAMQLQLYAHGKAIENNATAITLRVPQFLYDDKIKDIVTEIADIEEGVDENEDILREQQRLTDQIEGKIEIEVERLRNLIQNSGRSQDAKLEAIMRLLEQQLRDPN